MPALNPVALEMARQGKFAPWSPEKHFNPHLPGPQSHRGLRLRGFVPCSRYQGSRQHGCICHGDGMHWLEMSLWERFAADECSVKKRCCRLQQRYLLSRHGEEGRLLPRLCRRRSSVSGRGQPSVVPAARGRTSPSVNCKRCEGIVTGSKPRRNPVDHHEHTSAWGASPWRV